MDQLTPRYRWVGPSETITPIELIEAGTRYGLTARQIRLIASRGIVTQTALEALLAPSTNGLHDPALLPDAQRFLDRVERAITAGESILVYGDFDADGLTGLAVMARALRRRGARVTPYVPNRQDDGHGLSMGAIEHAHQMGHTLVVTVDCGTSNVAEVDAARALGVDVLITDHHRPPVHLPDAAAIVNPHLPTSSYPNRELTGSGVAFKLAQLLLRRSPGDVEAAVEFADLAAIGTLADLAPINGENRAIVRLGLESIREAPRPGLRALLDTAKYPAGRIERESIGFVLGPRLNALGRVGDAQIAATLLLTDDPVEAARLAAEVETANRLRRELMQTALTEARERLGDVGEEPLIMITGPWSLGIVGLVAGRLAEEHQRPAVVLSDLSEPLRGSARSPAGFDLAAAFQQCAHHFERYGGHPGAAGCTLRPGSFEGLRAELLTLAGPIVERDRRASLQLDEITAGADLDYALYRELARLETTAETPWLLGITGLHVTRVRAASGGHTQLVLRKGREVLDGIAFGWPELVHQAQEGSTIDIVARLTSRSFGGFESLQLEIRDAAPAGTIDQLRTSRATDQTAVEAIAGVLGGHA